MELPSEFLQELKTFPDNVYEKYLSVIDSPSYSGYRVNTLKADSEKIHNILGGNATPFCKNGYYFGENRIGIGKNPLHHAGAIYVQEPSAMSAVTALSPIPGDKVLDLCAAPGGKSTQIAAELRGEGLLVSNEFVGSRAKILASNIERMGISNAIVTSVRPDIICKEFQGFFDKVLVDAPCSGEGMFRKEPAAIQNWSRENVLSCAARQLKILESAADAVHSGGILCYSTCTFSPEEDEGVVSKFLKIHPEFHLISTGDSFGMNGFSQFGDDSFTLCRRVFPFHGGEGHFVALMQKAEDSSDFGDYRITYDTPPREFSDFWESTFRSPLPQNIVVKNDSVFIIPEAPVINNIHILRSGICAGEVRKNRFEPSHALFMCPAFVPRLVLDLMPDDPRLSAFLRGEQIVSDSDVSGYTAVAVDGISCGFGKQSGGVVKNHYPKGLRLLK